MGSDGQVKKKIRRTKMLRGDMLQSRTPHSTCTQDQLTRSGIERHEKLDNFGYSVFGQRAVHNP